VVATCLEGINQCYGVGHDLVKNLPAVRIADVYYSSGEIPNIKSFYLHYPCCTYNKQGDFK
jgi:hypothetical protein